MPRSRHRRGAHERKRPNSSQRALSRKARLNRIRRALASRSIDEVEAMRATWSEIKEATQTMSRYRDFDAAVADLEPLEFVVKGKKYTLAGDPPVGALLQLMAAGAFDKLDEDPKIGVEILRAFIGGEQVDEILSDGIGATQLSLLISWLMEELGFADEPVAEEGGGDEGNGSRSPMPSNIGELSTLTSGAATASTPWTSAGAGS